MKDSHPLERFMLEGRAERLKEAVAQRTRTLTVVLDGVHDPHNLSAVVRTCEGFGLLQMHVVETHAPFQVSHKICQGTEKWVDIHCHETPQACLQELTARGFDIWHADPVPGSRPVKELPWERPLALVFGNEHEGASSAIVQASLGSFHIPMYGFAQSFNVSVAAGITLATAVVQREKRDQGHADLAPGDQAALVTEWQRRSVRHADQILTHLKNESEREESHCETQS